MDHGARIIIDATGCTPAQAQACLDALSALGWSPSTAMPPPEAVPESPQVAALGAALASVPDGGVLTAHTDGACSGNPGPGGWSVVFSVGGAVIAEACGSVAFRHVMGHQGDVLNERADKLATGAVKQGSHEHG